MVTLSVVLASPTIAEPAATSDAIEVEEIGI
jgi:hypothetical protein